MSPSPSRIKRSPPKRSGPVRNGIASGSALGGALECGVRTAYAVIDEYMRRGYETARASSNYTNSERNGNGGTMNNEKQNSPNWSGPWGFPMGSMAPWIEQWSMAMRAWAEAWSAFIPGARPGPWPAASGFAAGATAPGVTVEVSSPLPTEVTVNLKPGAELIDLIADSFVPPLPNTVSITRKGGRVHVRVTVAADQAAGRYSGVVRASDGSVSGDLTIVIAEASK